jgi:hypothetical protein
MWADSQQAVSRQMCCAVALRRTAWSEHGMASLNQTMPHCVNQMRKTHSKPAACCENYGNISFKTLGTYHTTVHHIPDAMNPKKKMSTMKVETPT